MTVLPRLFAIISKEFRQLRRDRLTFGMIVGIPLLELVLFGYAINTDVRNLQAAYADQANTHLSRELVADLRSTQVLDFQFRVHGANELEELLREGVISVGVLIPADFDRRIVDGTRSAVQLLVDGSDPTILGVARQLTQMPVGFDLQAPPARPTPVFEVRNFYNPERRSAVNIVPGLIGVILTMTLTLFTAVAIARERERGNIEFLINTPVSTTELMVGKVIPYIAIGLIQVSLILGLGKLIFTVPVRGPLLDLYLASLTFIVANLSLGLFISTMVKTQFQAMQLSIFVMLPSILLSGFMFPFDGMPQLAQYIGEALPITHFIRLVRGIMLREAGIQDLLFEVYALVGFTVLMMAAAILRFRKRLD
jgi:ABC-2 type transport system permease protein